MQQTQAAQTPWHSTAGGSLPAAPRHFNHGTRCCSYLAAFNIVPTAILQVWMLNSGTYHGYRDYIVKVKEQGLPAAPEPAPDDIELACLPTPQPEAAEVGVLWIFADRSEGENQAPDVYHDKIAASLPCLPASVSPQNPYWQGRSQSLHGCGFILLKASR